MTAPPFPPFRALLYNLGGRQFVAVMVSGMGSFVALMAGRLEPGSYVTVTLGVIGVYVAGDAYTATRGNGSPPEKSK